MANQLFDDLGGVCPAGRVNGQALDVMTQQRLGSKVIQPLYSALKFAADRVQAGEAGLSVFICGPFNGVALGFAAAATSAAVSTLRRQPVCAAAMTYEEEDAQP